MDYRKEMNEAFNFLSEKKSDIKYIIKINHKIDEVMDNIEELFNDEYLKIYPNNYYIFNVISSEEFFDWCKLNIENFIGGEYDYSTGFWCDIKE